MKQVLVFLLSAIPTLWGLHGFEPAPYVPEDSGLYIEMAPVQQGIPQVKAFSSKLIGAPLWDVLAAQAVADLGLSSLDIKELSDAGFDTASPIGIHIEKTSDENLADDENIAIYLPAKDSSKVYALLKEAAEKNIAANKNTFSDQTDYDEEGNPIENGSAAQGSQVVEITPNQLFEITASKPIYVAKGKDFILIASKKEAIKTQLAPAAKPITNQDWYRKLKTVFLKKNNNQLPVVSFYVNPILLTKIVDMGITPQNEEVLSKDLITDMQENIAGVGGYWVFDETKTALSFTYLYKEGYLTSADSSMAKILQIPKGNLALESYKTLPVFLMTLKFNFPAAIEYVLSKDPQMRQDLDAAKVRAQQRFKIDIEKDLLMAFKGNFVTLIPSIPTEKTAKQYKSWDWYASLGIFKGKAAGLNSFFTKLAVEVKQKKEKNIAITSKKQGKDMLWTLSFPYGIDNTPTKLKTPDRVYVLIKDEEVLVGGSSNLNKFLKGNKPLANQITGSAGDRSHALVFLNLTTVIDYVSKGSMKGLVGPYLNFVKPLESIYLISEREGDSISSETVLKLK